MQRSATAPADARVICDKIQMKYYDCHNLEYQRRLKAGQVAWDDGAYEEFDMLPLIQRFLKETEFSSMSPCGLDLGCGTGGLSCYLAMQGFQMTAIDVSSTAIALALKQAAIRELAINFQVGDVCQIELPDESFDLITDNHFLHCIVFLEERQRVLRKIRKALKHEGEYWIETMVGHPDMKPRAEWNMDSQGITWAVVDENSKVKECVRKNGKTWLPIRRIQPNSQILTSEIQHEGLEIIWQETAPPIDENDTGVFRAKCRKNRNR